MTAPEDENPMLSIVGPGSIVSGKYRIGNMLGSGASSIVVEAHNIQNGQRYALKLLDADRVQRLGGPEVLLKAARAIAELKSEHTIRLLAVGALDNGAPYLLMEYLVGADFARVLAERGPLRVNEAADAMMQACDSLAEAHARGLVHGALKPQNLFVASEADGRRILKVGDYGGFGALDPAHSGERHAHSFEYASPEQLASQRVDARSDVWTLGVILFELVSGARPFEAKQLDELVRTRATAPPPHLLSRFGPVPDAFEATIRRCLAFDPGFRFQSAADVARSIAPFASGDLRELVPRMDRASERTRVSEGAPTQGAMSGRARLNEDAPTQAAMSDRSERKRLGEDAPTQAGPAPSARTPTHQHFSAAVEVETATTPRGRSGEIRVASQPPQIASKEEPISWSDVPTIDSGSQRAAPRQSQPVPSIQNPSVPRMSPAPPPPPPQSLSLSISQRQSLPPQQQSQQLIAVVQSGSRATNIALAVIALVLLLLLPLLYLHSLAKETEFAAPTTGDPSAEPTYTIEGPSAVAAPRLPPGVQSPRRPNTAPTNHR